MKHLNHKRTGAIVTTIFVLALGSAHATGPGVAKTPATAPAGMQQVAQTDVFKAVDVDKDGAVSQAELQAFDPVAAKDFSKFDADKDGKLTQQEFGDLVQAIRKQ